MIYLDHAATTPLDPRVLDRMTPFLTDAFGNPNSLHSAGRRAREAMEDARALVADCIGASENEIVFTGCGSESNNLALRGVASARRTRGRHLIISGVEHPSVMATAEALEREGGEVTVLSVDSAGMVSAESVATALRQDTVLVSVMHASNEVGSIEPIEEIAEICRERRVYFHTDAVQTAGKLPIDLSHSSIDLLSLSGHKFYGPKGVGVLYIRSGTKVHAQITGGGQERSRRSGTENVAAVVGLAEALRLAVGAIEDEEDRESLLRDRLLAEIPLRVPDTLVSGHPTLRLPNHASFCFRGVEGEAVLLALDNAGIAGSAGSACSSGSLEPPHALLAMGIQRDYARGSLRLTIGRGTTEQDVDEVIARIPGIVAGIRELARPASV